MVPHSSTLGLKIPWTEEPGGLQSMGLLRVGHNSVTSLSLFTFMHWRRKRQPTPVFLLGESQGQRSLVGCRLWGRTELDTTEATQQYSIVLCIYIYLYIYMYIHGMYMVYIPFCYCKISCTLLSAALSLKDSSQEIEKKCFISVYFKKNLMMNKEPGIGFLWEEHCHGGTVRPRRSTTFLVI